MARKERYQPVIQVLKQQFGPRLRTVVLFGSRARGEARPNSDHDLFVVIGRLPVEPVARQRLVRTALLDILGELPGTVNFVAKTPEEVAANLTPLLLDICVDGICLFGEEYFEPYRRKALIALQQSNLQRQKLGATHMWLLPKGPSGNWELNWEGYRAGS
jgi:predicted nucleotidyltransferase